jgi:hypothetical protein
VQHVSLDDRRITGAPSELKFQFHPTGLNRRVAKRTALVASASPERTDRTLRGQPASTNRVQSDVWKGAVIGHRELSQGQHDKAGLVPEVAKIPIAHTQDSPKPGATLWTADG